MLEEDAQGAEEDAKEAGGGDLTGGINKFAQTMERAHVKNLREDISKLIKSADKDKFDITMLGKPSEVVLPTQEVSGACGDTELLGQV